MNNMRELLKKQLDESTPCDGDYLKGRTIEEVANELFAKLTENGTSSLENLQEYVVRVTEDWKLHKGEKMLYVAEQTNGNQKHRVIQIAKIWESEMDQYADKPFARYMGKDETIPMFDMDEQK